MEITLTELYIGEPQPVLAGGALGDPCTFASEIGGGPALLARRARPGAATPGGVLEVELVPEAVGELHPLPDQPEPDPTRRGRLEPVPGSPGDFWAAGQVTSLVWLDDELSDAQLEVLVGPALFSFPAELAGEAGLEWGGWVTFRLHRLVLQVRDPG